MKKRQLGFVLLMMVAACSPAELLEDAKETVGQQKACTFKHFSHSDAGADGQWMTDDDMIGFLTISSIDVASRTATTRAYQDPGNDGVWATADDEVFTFAWDSDGPEIDATVVRLDKEWNIITTEHRSAELIVAADRYFYEEGEKVAVLSLEAPGADGKWFTDDDDSVFLSRWVYTADGRLSWTGYADFSGNDWQTFNDFLQVTYYAYDAAGKVTEETLVDAGLDTLMGTADDRIFSITAVEWNGGKATYRTYGIPGLDGKWRTPDDHLLIIRIEDSDTGGNLVAETIRGPGLDGIWNNDDDMLYEWAYSYDQLGNEVQSVHKVDGEVSEWNREEIDCDASINKSVLGQARR